PASSDAVGERVAQPVTPTPEPPPMPTPTPTLRPRRQAKAFVCLCEDVTTKDIERTVAEGYDDIELAKRYSTVFMGPCQGKMCQLHATRELARQTGRNLAEV